MSNCAWLRLAQRAFSNGNASRKISRAESSKPMDLQRVAGEN
jgi:hypothetical protein